MLTVEDANTIIRKYGVESFYYTIDTGSLPLPSGGSGSFTDYECEFFTISKTYTDNQWQWTFTVKNKYFLNHAYAFDQDNNFITQVSVDNGMVNVFVSSDASRPIVTVELTILGNGLIPGRLTQVYVGGVPKKVTLANVGKSRQILIKRLTTGETYSATVHTYVRVNSYPIEYGRMHYFLIRLQKTWFKYNCNSTLTCGKVNKVRLGTLASYKPGGALIQDNTPTITVEYKNTTIPVTWSETDNDYIFYLDLTEDYNPGKVNLNVLVETNDVLNESIDNVTLYKEVMEVDNFDALRVEISDGTGLIRLTDTMLFRRDLTIANDVKIIGNNNILDLDAHHIHLEEGKTLILNDVTVQYGSPAIIQEPNTTLELNRCTFTNNFNTYNNNLGACVYCNTDVEGLTVTDDYTTRITDCLFQDNESTIFHGGQLTITGSKFIIQDNNWMKANNPAFLYQTDGEANITNSSFVIIQDGDEWCSNEKNIGYAQSILICGENAIINGADHTSLQKQNSLPFYDTYNNKTYLYAKYYYPRLEGCVVTSPLPGFEDKNCTYAVSGVDWVFKQNSQVTLPDQANNNQPNWEEW